MGLRLRISGYTASGVLEKLQIGNGLWETAQLNSRLQVTQLGLGTSPTDASVWKLNYDFGNSTNNDGNIKAQTLTTPNAIYTQTFQYDSLDRLKQAQERAEVRPGFRISPTTDTAIVPDLIKRSTGKQPALLLRLMLIQIASQQVRATPLFRSGNVVQDQQNRQFIFNGDNKQVEVRNA